MRFFYKLSFEMNFFNSLTYFNFNSSMSTTSFSTFFFSNLKTISLNISGSYGTNRKETIKSFKKRIRKTQRRRNCLNHKLMEYMIYQFLTQKFH